MAGFLIPRYRQTADLSILGLGNVDVISMNHSQSSRITEFPVESGSVITDHIQSQPNRVTVRGMIGSLFAVGSYKSEQVPNAWQALRKSREKGELFTFATDLQIYENMAIASVRTPRTKHTGRTSMVFELDLKEIRFSKVQEQDINPGSSDPNTDADNPVKDRAVDDTNRGGVGVVDTPTNDLPDPTGDEGTDKGGGGFGGHGRDLRFDELDDELDQDGDELGG